MRRFVIGVLAASVVLSSGGMALARDDGGAGSRWQRPAYEEGWARPGHPGRGNLSDIEARMGRQEWRIEEGVRRGEISPREEHFLRNQLRRTAAAERYFLRDGYMNGWESERLRSMLDRNNEAIRWARHNESYGPRY